MSAKIFISFFLILGFAEALLTPKEIEAKLQSLELAKSEFEVEIQTLELSNTKLRQAFEVAKSENELNIATLDLSNTKLNQEVNRLKTQVSELLESKCESKNNEANQTLENVQDQAEWHLIVATGSRDNAKRTEAFNWQNEDNSTCGQPDYPNEIYGAVPVMINDTEYVCGGKEPITAQCFNLITGENAPFSLLHKRVFASSVTTNVTNFVFGGTDGSSALATYETISVDHAQSEGVLPFTWQKGCSTLINSTTILLAGGIQNETENNKGRTGNTWFFNLRTKEWTQGPTMIQDRYWFGCGYISGINSVAVFGGGQPPMATTEIVKLPGGSFKKADDLPFKLYAMSTLQDPTDFSSLVVSGGFDWTNGQMSAAILKLTCTLEEDCKWQILGHKLQVPRTYHVSFFTNKPLNCTN